MKYSIASERLKKLQAEMLRPKRAWEHLPFIKTEILQEFIDLMVQNNLMINVEFTEGLKNVLKSLLQWNPPLICAIPKFQGLLFALGLPEEINGKKVVKTYTHNWHPLQYCLRTKQTPISIKKLNLLITALIEEFTELK